MKVQKSCHSLKSEIEVRPLRVWSENAVHGVLLIGFIAQMMISLTRYFVTPVSSVSTKFISNSLQNLTVTVVPTEDGRKRRYYSNFDSLNRAILSDYMAETWTVSASGTVFRGGFGVLRTRCQILKLSENEMVRCQS